MQDWCSCRGCCRVYNKSYKWHQESSWVPNKGKKEKDHDVALHNHRGQLGDVHWAQVHWAGLDWQLNPELPLKHLETGNLTWDLIIWAVYSHWDNLYKENSAGEEILTNFERNSLRFWNLKNFENFLYFKVLLEHKFQFSWFLFHFNFISKWSTCVISLHIYNVIINKWIRNRSKNW